MGDVAAPNDPNKQRREGERFYKQPVTVDPVKDASGAFFKVVREAVENAGFRPTPGELAIMVRHVLAGLAPYADLAKAHFDGLVKASAAAAKAAPTAPASTSAASTSSAAVTSGQPTS